MKATHDPTRSAGENLIHIMRRLNAAGDAWAAADYPDDGPLHEAREAAYAELRAWNERSGQPVGSTQ